MSNTKERIPVQDWEERYRFIAEEAADADIMKLVVMHAFWSKRGDTTAAEIVNDEMEKRMRPKA